MMGSMEGCEIVQNRGAVPGKLEESACIMIGLALDKGEHCRVLQASHWLPSLIVDEPRTLSVEILLEEDYK